ncbi:unnamed protein product [Caenorhabditis nigoni]
MVSMESAMEKSAMKNTNDSSTFISKIHLSGSGYGHLEFSSPDTVIFNDAVVRQVDAQTLAGLVGVTNEEIQIPRFCHSYGEVVINLLEETEPIF